MTKEWSGQIGYQRWPPGVAGGLEFSAASGSRDGMRISMGLHRPPKGTAGALIRFGGEGYAACARRWLALMQITVVMFVVSKRRQASPTDCFTAATSRRCSPGPSA
jgi:hypothetical protein